MERKNHNNMLTTMQAYKAMLLMLEYYFNLTHDEEAVRTILGAGGLDKNGNILDEGFYEYFEDAVVRVLNGDEPSKSSFSLNT